MKQFLLNPTTIKTLMHGLGVLCIGLATQGVLQEPWAGFVMWLGGALQGGAFLPRPGDARPAKAAPSAAPPPPTAGAPK